MNLDRLRPGLVVASHKEMCELLGEKYIKSTSSIKSKEKRWALFFLFHKEGRSYIIDEIYEIPKKAPFSPNDKYSRDILNCISYRLCYLGEETHLFSNIELLKCCGFINRNWGLETPLNEYAIKHMYSLKEAQFHFNVLRKRVEEFSKDHLTTTLKRLNEKGYITYCKQPLIRIASKERTATQKEVDLYEKIKAKFLEQNEIAYIGTPYFNKFQTTLKKGFNINGFEGFRFAHLIDLIPDDSEAADPRMLFDDAAESFLSINKRCIKSISKTIDKDVDKSTFNYLRLYSDPCSPTITFCPSKSRSERISDRGDLLDIFIKIEYDDIFGEDRDSYIWGEEGV